MRTKHILLSMALGVAVVGCSENEFMTVDNNTNDAKLSIRPVADVTITLANDEASTRFALGTGARPVWSTNDKLGAAVIDVPTYSSAADYATKLAAANGKAIALYNVNESYGCNNAFSTTDGGGTWSSDQPMVEGNYLFYAPYQVGLNYRSPLEVAVPRIQDASGAKTALAEFYNGDNIVQVGYKFITGGEKQKPVVTMFNLFAYPKFTIKNNFDGYLFDGNGQNATATQAYSGTMKVDSIQFVNVDAAKAAKTGMVIGGKLKHSTANGTANHSDNVATTTPTSAIMALHQKDNGFTNDGKWHDLDYMLKAETKEFLNSADQVMTGRHNNSGDDKMKGVITTLIVDQNIEQGKSLDIYAVMPASKFDYAGNQLAAKVFVTINGIQYVICEGVFKASAVDAQDAAHTKLNATATQGYSFTAKNNVGLTSLSFMAGQSLPAEALYVDGDIYKKKDVGGDLFTVELKGGQPVKAGTSNVQIALRTSATSETGIKTTDELITMIKTKAPNGTAWSEGADAATTKGYTIAATNTVEINSALIDALATNNQNTGGSFAISTVAPITNDVKVTAVVGNVVTFESANGKTYDITLIDAETNTGTAADKYAIIDTDVPSAYNTKSVVIVSGNSSITLTAATAMKSVHVVSGKTLTVSGDYKLTVGNMRNDGAATVAGDLDAKLVNNGTLDISKGITGTVTNNGTIDVKASTAKFTVAAGKGMVTMTEGTTTSNVTIASAATQDVIYVCSLTLETTQIIAAAAIKSVNVIKAAGLTTLTQADIAKFGTIKRIQIATAGIETKDAKTYDLKGFTIELLGNATWTGTSDTQSIVNNATVTGNYLLTLATISVNGTSVGKVEADGTTAKWNGGAGNNN